MTAAGMLPRPATGLRALTPREREVLGLMAAGCSNAGIAASLWLSTKTVESHIGRIYAKLGLGEDDKHPRVSAVLLYLGATARVEDPRSLPVPPPPSRPPLAGFPKA